MNLSSDLDFIKGKINQDLISLFLNHRSLLGAFQMAIVTITDTYQHVVIINTDERGAFHNDFLTDAFRRNKPYTGQCAISTLS